MVNALTFDSSGNLYVGGGFSSAGSTTVNNIAKWSPSSNTWSALNNGVTVGVSAVVNAVAFDSSSGNLYVGGSFLSAGSTTVNYIAKWSPSTNTWSSLNSVLSVGVSAMVNAVAFDSSSGNLYVGGNFLSAGLTTVNYIAKWNTSIYVLNTTSTRLYLQYSGVGSIANLLYYDDSAGSYSQVN